MLAFLLTSLLLPQQALSAIRITPDNFQLALDRLPTLCQQAIDTGAVPGLSIAVVYNGTTRFSRGFGIRKEGGTDTVDETTVFQIASCSKPISASVISSMVSSGTNGDLSWTSYLNEPNTIAEYSDSWISSQIQLQDSFSHRTGLWGFTGDDLEYFNFNRTEILKRIKYMEPIGPFRAAYSYSNYGLTAGAQSAAKRISKDKEWADVEEEFLFNPLGMSSTTGRDSVFLTRTNRAALHARPISNATDDSDGNQINSTKWIPTPHRNPDPQSPAGGISSNVVDLSIWLKMVLSKGINPTNNQRLISESVLEDSHIPRSVRNNNPVTNRTGFYALGMDVDYTDDQVYLGHAGAFSQGTRSLFKIDIEQGLGVVVLANCFPTGWPEGITDTFFDLAMFGEVRRDYVKIWNDAYNSLVSSSGGDTPPVYSGNQPANATGMLPAQRYAGLYQNGYIGNVKIDIGGKGDAELTMTFPGSSNASVAIKHWDRDSFFIAENQGDISYTGIEFTIGADGNAQGMVVDMLNTNSGGVLTRSG